MTFPVFVGYDRREDVAYGVCVRSLTANASMNVRVEPILEAHERAVGRYWRPHERRNGKLWCPISEADMATDFAITRFLVPWKADCWALFCDADFMWRGDVTDLFAQRDPSKAVQVVQHDYRPTDTTKMDGQTQTAYPRKNWSSLILWNCAHRAHERLTLEMVNSLPGRDLHRFCWLHDEEIGDLDPTWNWLEGHHDPAMDPKAVHYTRGTPDMVGRPMLFDDEYQAWAERVKCAAS